MDFLFPARIEPCRKELAALEPVVLMGRGHSGTRVLSWICTHLGVKLGTLNTSAPGDVQDLPFQDAILRLARRTLDATRPAEVRQSDLADFQRAVWRYYDGLGRPSGPWGWKFPEAYLIAPGIERTFPKARYIHLVRDGRDLAFKEHLTDNPRRTLGRAILKRCGALRKPRHLQAALSWAYQVDRFDAFKSDLPAGRVLEMSYNQLCLDPAGMASRVCDFLRLTMTDDCRRYLQTEVQSGKVDQFRKEDPATIREIESAIGPTLRRHGFGAG
ncbi:MAG: sulfotransferase [Verrucomicrobiota bacterium]